MSSLLDNMCIFHADDYGASRDVSAHMRDCIKDGYCNSISVLPNGGSLDEDMRLLEPYRDKVRISIHLNLAEGHCVADPQKLDLLVDERGMFCASFFQILLWSYTGKRNKLKEQICIEYAAQISRMIPHLNKKEDAASGYDLRIDSHQHYHLIPLVFTCLLASVERVFRMPARDAITFLRIPAEPISPFIRQPGLYFTYRPINLIKNFVLNILNIGNRRALKPFRKKSAVFMGILLSGGMDLQRVRRLMPSFLKIAKKKGVPFELLCHPGGTNDPGQLMDQKNAGCVAFYTSKGRQIEKNTLLHIGEQKVES